MRPAGSSLNLATFLASIEKRISRVERRPLSAVNPDPAMVAVESYSELPEDPTDQMPAYVIDTNTFVIWDEATQTWSPWVDPGDPDPGGGGGGEIDYVALDSRYVNTVGDTMLGPLTATGLTASASTGAGTILASAAAGLAELILAGASGATKAIRLRTGSALRWAILSTNAAEVGGNAGSDFAIVAYTDAGTQNFVPLRIDRSSGEVTVEADPVSDLGVATKQYVDGKIIHSTAAPSGTEPAGTLWVRY